MAEVSEFCPLNQEDWRSWLEENHATEKAVWLFLYKKGAAQFNLSWSQAVDEALCFGWIDSTKKTVNKECYKQYFTWRKPNSNWSKVNKKKVEQLIAKKRMTAAGLKTIAVAKENGSWNNLDSIDNLEVPDDLLKKLTQSEGALEYFQGLSNSAKKLLLYWVASAKRPETRTKRISEIALEASQQQKPKQFR